MAKYRLAVLVEALDHVCFRYRMQAFAPALAAAGWQIEQHVVPKTWTGWAQLAQRLRSADVLVLQRLLLPFSHRRWLQSIGRPWVFDFDDAVYLRSFERTGNAVSWRRERRFRGLVHHADRTWAGNSVLASHALRYAANGDVNRFPTCVALDRYPAALHTRTGRDVRCVWIGSRSTSSALLDGLPCLQAAADVGVSHLRVVCDYFPTLPRLDVEEVRWSAETEIAQITSADVGISWLPRHPWSAGKCGLKVLQYMAAGLPVIGNRVGENLAMIVPGVNGFLADTPAEWAEAARCLADDPALRQRLGDQARKWVQERYSVAAWSPWLVAQCESLVAARDNSKTRLVSSPLALPPAANSPTSVGEPV